MYVTSFSLIHANRSYFLSPVGLIFLWLCSLIRTVPRVWAVFVVQSIDADKSFAVCLQMESDKAKTLVADGIGRDGDWSVSAHEDIDGPQHTEKKP